MPTCSGGICYFLAPSILCPGIWAEGSWKPQADTKQCSACLPLSADGQYLYWNSHIILHLNPNISLHCEHLTLCISHFTVVSHQSRGYTDGGGGKGVRNTEVSSFQQHLYCNQEPVIKCSKTKMLHITRLKAMGLKMRRPICLLETCRSCTGQRWNSRHFMC